MSEIIVGSVSVSIPLLGANLTETGVIEDLMVSSAIRRSLLALREAVSACYESNTNRVLLEESQLPPEFFDLSTGLLVRSSRNWSTTTSLPQRICLKCGNAPRSCVSTLVRLAMVISSVRS